MFSLLRHLAIFKIKIIFNGKFLLRSIYLYKFIKLNILIINTQTEGGAAKSFIRLFEGFKSKEDETIVFKF
jgi:hypothetical protein